MLSDFSNKKSRSREWMKQERRGNNIVEKRRGFANPTARIHSMNYTHGSFDTFEHISLQISIVPRAPYLPV
jgi:hypothetical protein